MMYVGSSEVALFRINGVDLLAARLQELKFTIAVSMEETTGIGHTWDEQTPTGLRTCTVEQTGAYFVADTAGIHELLTDWPPGPYRLELAMAGDDPGAPVLVAEGALVTSYEVLAASQKITRANATYTISGAVRFERFDAIPAMASAA